MHHVNLRLDGWGWVHGGFDEQMKRRIKIRSGFVVSGFKMDVSSTAITMKQVYSKQHGYYEKAQCYETSQSKRRKIGAAQCSSYAAASAHVNVELELL